MMRQNVTTIERYPIPETHSTEIQVLADMIAFPESVIEASRILTADMFDDEKCRQAFLVLIAMPREGMVIDLPSVFGRIDKDLLQKGIMPMMINSASATTAVQHFGTLKGLYIKRKCYFKAIELLIGSADTKLTADDLVSKIASTAENLRNEMGNDREMQHISSVLDHLGEEVEEKMRLKAEGKTLRVPTGFYTLNYLTYGGFNAGNLVILAARPSVGKTAVMLQMARAAALAGKAVNLFNLEMTNTELAQRMLYSTGQVTPLQMARGEVEWKCFELASAQFASKPIYLNDTASTPEEIISRITLNAQAGKCDIAFIDYLGLMQMNNRLQLTQAIAEVTKQLKKTANACGIPIVLLCQLNRTSASESRSPMMHDLRDSGSIEQDADIILMLERSADAENEVNMWVRKNRQGKAGDIKVEIVADNSYTSFIDKGEPPPPPEIYNEFNETDF